MVMMLWPRNHAWTQGHHLMKTLLEARLLLWQQFLYIIIYIYIYIYIIDISVKVYYMYSSTPVIKHIYVYIRYDTIKTESLKLGNSVSLQWDYQPIDSVFMLYIYIYMYIVIHRQTVSLYHNSSVWLDT